MRTNVDIDDKLIAKAMKKTGAKTKREVIELGLKELVREPPDYSTVLAHEGKLLFAREYDPKAIYGNRTGDE